MAEIFGSVREGAEAGQTAQPQNEANNLSGPLIAVLDPTSPAAEAYRTLRTNLFYAFVDNPPQGHRVHEPQLRGGQEHHLR